nr:hypothetical protein [Tanacetum cinerariifolium]
MANDKENHALTADEETLTEFALMAKTSAESETGLPEFKDDTITDYSRPSPAVESSLDDAQNKNSSVTTTEASPSTILPKPFIKFVKANGSPTKSKTDKVKIAKKPPIKYAEQYRKPTKKPNVKGNQKNWNNLKSHHLGINFVMKKKACFNCGDFNHLAYDYSKRMKRGTSRPQNNTHKNFTPRPVVHRPYRPPMRPMRPNMNAAQPTRTSFYKPAHSYTKRPFQRTSTVRLQYRGPRVPPVSRKFSTVNTKFPTANRKFPTGGTEGKSCNLEKFEAKGDEVKKDVSSLRYIALPNWVHDDLLESSTSKPQDDCSTAAPESSILRVTTHSVDSDGVEADVSNMEITMTASPTPTLRIHKDHPKSQIIGPVDTPIQTRNKSKEVGEQSFIAIIHQKTDPPLLQFCLFSCFISQVEPKKIFDALQDPS